MTDREAHLVELVDDHGTPIGSSTVADAHTAPGQLHRAFSVLLFDRAGRTLLQQRAAAKTRFPLQWGNTCCGHPRPGEAVAAEASLRLAEEIGVHSVELADIGVYPYRAADPATGRVEYEYDHVLIGRIDADAELAPDPVEVATLRWVPAVTLTQILAGDEGKRDYTPWLAGVLSVAMASDPLSDLV